MQDTLTNVANMGTIGNMVATVDNPSTPNLILTLITTLAQIYVLWQNKRKKKKSNS